MADTARNLIQMTVASVASAGLGTLTLGAAVADYLAFESGDNGLTFTVTITEAGVGQEVRTGCTYTHSGTTLTRGTLEKSTTLSAIAFSSAAIVSVTASADRGRRWDSAALDHVAGANAATTMVVGSLYVVDGATLTADRTYTLPATAAVGDRIGVMMSAGSSSYEVLLTAGSGDTLNGIAGGTEWSRLFITGETVVMRCVAANATWVVEHDGRIPCCLVMTAASAQTGVSASTWVTLTQGASGSWTTSPNVGAMADTANHAMVARRSGNYVASVVFAVALLATQLSLLAGFRLNGAGNPRRVCRLATSTASSATVGGGGSLPITLAAGDYLQGQVLHTDSTSRSTEYISGESIVTLSMVEIL